MHCLIYILSKIPTIRTAGFRVSKGAWIFENPDLTHRGRMFWVGLVVVIVSWSIDRLFCRFSFEYTGGGLLGWSTVSRLLIRLFSLTFFAFQEWA